MDNFIVSARKYRPVTFNTVVGQISITGTLKNAIRNNQLAQAFLFCGPRGVGKTTCARILAKTINCLNPTSETEPCNECTSCRAFNDSASFNIHELDAASNNSVDDIRNLVDQVRIPPQMGKYKVYIIDEVHMLSPAAFNAFLKTLEEPPAYAKFILATTEKHKIIPTILSRCQIFDFKRITVDDIAKHLAFVANSEGVSADPEALHIIAHKADGALRDALSVFDQMVNLGDRNISRELVLENLNVLDYEYYFRIMDCMMAGNYKDILLIVNEVIEKGFDGQHFITGLGEHLRNLLMSIDPGTVKLIETSDTIRAKYASQAQTVSIQLLIDALDIINKCDVTYRTSNNKRLSLEVSLIQICRLSGNLPTNVASRPSAGPPVPDPIPAPSPVQPLVVPAPKQSEYTVKDSSPEPVRVEEPQTPKPPSAVITEKPVVQSVETAPKPQNSGEKPVEKQSVAEPVHDVPVQSHHISSFSIKSVMKADELANSVKTEVKKDRTEDFSPEQINEAILSYAESNKQDSALLYSALTERYPHEIQQPGNLLIISVVNNVLQAELNLGRNALLDFLRDKMKNDSITLQVIVNEPLPTETKKYMTDRDKLDDMASRNPNVNKLRDQLNLELDLQ